MRIGLRTVKTAISATLAMVVANNLDLLYPSAAGIIALLSVTNSKKSSLQVGVYRLLSLSLATIIAYGLFHIFGYHPYVFGLYLLLFIPLTVSLKMTDGIPVSSVIVTHYLSEQRVDIDMIRNSFLLMLIGVGFALLMNMYMPNYENKLKADQQFIEEKVRILLREMSKVLVNQDYYNNCQTLLKEVVEAIDSGEKWAMTHLENKLLTSNQYYIRYFDMRRVQLHILKDMNHLVHTINVEEKYVIRLQDIFLYTADTLSEENDGIKIKNKIKDVYHFYENMPLPQTREEFENRAKLYELLNDFTTFIDVKTTFSKKNNL